MVEEPAVVAGHGSDHHAHADRDEHGRDAHGQRDAPSIEHAGHQILSEVVGAEGVDGARRAELGPEIDLVHRRAPDERADDEHERDPTQHAGADQGEAVAPEPTPRFQGQAAGARAARVHAPEHGVSGR